MARSLTTQHKNKMQEGRKRWLSNRYGLVCRLPDGYEIWADQYTLILRSRGRSEIYLPTIEAILQEIMEDKAKLLMIADQRKTLESVRDAVIGAREWMTNVVKPVLEGGK